MTETNFADMTAANGNDYEYDFEDFETFEFPDEDGETATVVGELLARRTEVGRYDSTVYLLESDGEKVMVWGNGSIDAAFENSDAEVGDMLGIRKTGETYTNEYGTFPSYEVRFSKA